MTSDDETYAHNPAGRMTSAGSHDFDLQRFVKFCGLLSSSVDVERSAAALKATEMLKKCGLTWEDVAVSASALKPVSPQNFSAISGAGRNNVRNVSPHSRSPYRGADRPAGGHQFWRDGADRPTDREQRSAAPQSATGSNPKFKVRFGLTAIDVVYAVFSTAPDLTDWEQDLINKLVIQANTTRPSDFALSEKQWASLLGIAQRADLVERTSRVPESYQLNRNHGDPSWARR